MLNGFAFIYPRFIQTIDYLYFVGRVVLAQVGDVESECSRGTDSAMLITNLPGNLASREGGASAPCYRLVSAHFILACGTPAHTRLRHRDRRLRPIHKVHC